MNSVILTGALKDNSTFNKGVAKNTIVVKNDFGAGKQFFNLIAFKEKANDLAKFKKNEIVYVSGRIEMSKYNDKYYTNIVVGDIEKIGGVEENIEEEQVDVEEETQEQAQMDEIADDLGVDVADDDLPF